MLHKWKIKWSNVDFVPVKCEVQHAVPQMLICGGGRVLGIMEPQELLGLLLTGRGTMRSSKALYHSMYFCVTVVRKN